MQRIPTDFKNRIFVCIFVSCPVVSEWDLEMQIFTGAHNQYHWIEWKDGYLWDLLDEFPQVVLGHFLVNTSFDSGSLTLSSQQLEWGWRRQGEFTLIPPLPFIEHLATDMFDEWYFFSNGNPIDRCKVFVNHCGFSLQNPDHRTMQDEFWTQLERLQPESYLSEGDKLIYVTKDESLFKDIQAEAFVNE